MKKTIIKLENIKKDFFLESWERIKVLKWIDLEIKTWEFISLMWESWSGKSTLLNIIWCLFNPSSWKYNFEWEDISWLIDDDTLSFIRNKKMWYIFQQFHLIPTFSVIENIMIPWIYYGLSKTERLEKAEKTLKKLWLEDKFHMKPWSLSWWEQQRVAIARALLNDTQVLLADEPTWSLDSNTSIEIMDLLKSLNKKWLTIIMVTHSKETAEYADRILFLKDGNIKK